MSRCLECGYDLGGSARGARCPQCGTRSTDIELTGGLAGVGALSARPADRIAIAAAALLVIPLTLLILARLVDARDSVHATLREISYFTQAFALLAGAYLCVLVGRMLPAELPWRRMLWIVMAVRIAGACALLGFALTSVVPTAVVAELQVVLAADLLFALAVARIAPTGGLSRASAVPAYTAVAGAGYGMVLTHLPLAYDPSGIASGVMQSGAVGAVACAIALWRIKRELHAN